MACPDPQCDQGEPCFVHCVYCAVDCIERVPHSSECPMATGIFPNEDARRCLRCSCNMDVYTGIEVGPKLFEAVCIGCAAQAMI